MGLVVLAYVAVLVVAVLIFQFLVPSCEARAEDVLPRSVFPAAPVVDRLPNGLTLVTVDTGDVGVVAYFTLVRVGSRDEVEPGRSGYAHLFEHMMFRGTESRPGPEYERTMQGFGADHNAYTTNDYTLYTITVPSSVLPDLVAVEAERFQHLAFDDEGYRAEVGAVLGEYATTAADPTETMWQTLSALAFRRHPYGHTTLGHLADVCAMASHVDYARAFFRRYYTPDDTTLVVVGDVRREALLALVERHYGAWSGHRDRPAIPEEPEPTAGARRDLAWPGPSEPALFVAYRTPSFAGPEEASPEARRAALRETVALEVVHALAFSEASPLYERLVERERVALDLGSWDGDFTRDPALFVVAATLSTPASANRVIDAIDEELAAVARGERDALFADARSAVRYERLSSIRTVDDVAEQLARTFAVSGSPGAFAELVAATDEVTVADVRRVAARYLVRSRRFVVTLRGGAQEGGAVGEPDAPSASMCDSIEASP
ncbi:MAG: pitrilysin family protein [Polyangiales bacterium]